MSSKYANLEWLALFLANGHCHSTWGEKRLKHEFQSGMLAALHGFCSRHGNNLPKLQHDFVLIFVLRIVATVTAPGKEPRLRAVEVECRFYINIPGLGLRHNGLCL